MALSDKRVLLMGVLLTALWAVNLQAQEGNPDDGAYDDMEAAGAFDFGDTGDVSAEVKDTAPVTSEDEDAIQFAWLYGAERHHATQMGTTGLLKLAEAGTLDQWGFAMGLHLWGFYNYDDYLIKGDKHSATWSNLHLTFAPLEFLEVALGVQAYAVHNTAVTPELFQTIGDLNLSVKGAWDINEWIAVGAMADVRFLSAVGRTSYDADATTVGLRALGTFDFSHFNEKLPIRGHVNAGYLIDNSANLIESIEEQQGGCGTDADGDNLVTYEGCIGPVERTALGVNRVDQVVVGVGFDAALPYVSPMLEWQLGIPVNARGDFSCPSGIEGSFDSCLGDEGFSAYQQTLTVGARILPPIHSLSIDVGVDIGLTGYAPSVHELAAEAPYRVMFGVTYAVDPRLQKALKQQSKPAPVTPVAMPVFGPTGLKIAGTVHVEGEPTKTVAGAQVVYEGFDHNSQITDDSGRFLSYEFEPGQLIVLTVQAEGYEDNTCSVQIPEDDPAVPRLTQIEAACTLPAPPTKSTLVIQLVDENNVPLNGIEMRLIGPQETTLVSGLDGRAEDLLDPGKYVLMVENENYLRRQMVVELPEATRTESQIVLRQRPKKASAEIRRNRIIIKDKIRFKTGSAEIQDRSLPLLEEIADVIISTPEVKMVEIQGHTDNVGRKDYNIKLSKSRADSVRAHLITLGVEPHRLTADGFGPNRPIAPNITRSGRARNRRVEFHITSRKK